MNTRMANAFVQQYVAVKLLTFDKTERTPAGHLMRHCGDRLHTKRSKDDIPLTFLKALCPMVKTGLQSVSTRASEEAVSGIWKEATIGKPSGVISSCRSVSLAPGVVKTMERMASQRVDRLPKAALMRRLNPQDYTNHQ